MKDFYLRHKSLMLKITAGVVIIGIVLIYLLGQSGYDDHLEAGDKYMAEGRYYNALAEYEQMSRALPESAPAYRLMAGAYIMINDFEAAIAVLDTAISLDSSNYLNFGNRGYCRMKLNQPKAALADFNLAIERNPDADTLYLHRAQANLKLGANDEVVSDCSLAIAYNPANPAGWYNRGLGYRYAGQYDRALDDIKKAMLLQPRGTWFYITRAEIYQELGRYDESLADCEHALKLSPQFAEPYLTIAAVKKAREDWQGAIDAYDTFRDNMPGLSPEFTDSLDSWITQMEEKLE